MTLFWKPEGPLLQYQFGVLHIHDLNPELHATWRMSRLEMIRVGLNFIFAGTAARLEEPEHV